MRLDRRGSSLATVLGVIAVLVIAAGAAVYFGSKVFRTRINHQIDQFSEWTPENIAKYPNDYLNFCEAETKQAMERLKASEIAIAQKMSKLETLQGEARERIDLGKKALEDLKSAYKSAAARDSWPLTWRENKLDKDRAKRQIIRFDKDFRSRDDLVARYTAAVNQLRAQASKLQDARDTAQSQLAKIDSNREMLKIQEITGDLKSNLIAMKGVIETSVVGVAATDSGPVSIDDLAAQSEGAVNEKEFAAILGK
jgi:hypothetical protein